VFESDPVGEDEEEAVIGAVKLLDGDSVLVTDPVALFDGDGDTDMEGDHVGVDDKLLPTPI
jgi:hypothetical protein